MEAKRPLSDLDWALTPQAVKQYIIELENIVGQLAKRHEALEKRTDTLETCLNQIRKTRANHLHRMARFKKPKRKRKKGKRKRGGQKGHKGHRQQMLAPTAVKNLLPDRCQCGQLSLDRKSILPYYTHQHIELPEIKMDVTHYILHKASCNGCGRTVKARLPRQFCGGYGPRLSAVIAELSGSHGASRLTVQDFCQSVLGVPISTGGIQRIIDRVSEPLSRSIPKLVTRPEKRR